jgi:hypothetical protein
MLVVDDFSELLLRLPIVLIELILSYDRLEPEQIFTFPLEDFEKRCVNA